MKNKLLKGLVASFFLAVSGIANAGLIGVFGDYYQSNLQSNLVGLGHTVTYLGAEVNQDLSAFDSVWGVSAFNPLSATESSYLSSFLTSGGGLYLTGERPCCEALNDSVQSFLNSVVLGGGIQVGDLGDAGSSMTINASAVGGLASLPNTVTTWKPGASGAIGGVSGDNVFAFNGSKITAAGWDMSDLIGNSGRIMLMMDVNWHSGADSNDLAILENIEVFLDGATANTAQVPEPSTLAIFALGIMGLASRKFKKQA